MNIVLFCGGLGVRMARRRSGFRSLREALSNDFVQSNGGRDAELLGSDIAEGRVSFIEAGARATVGPEPATRRVQHLPEQPAWNV
jgi:glucose-1-phosphate cytidylyltransferase